MKLFLNSLLLLGSIITLQAQHLKQASYQQQVAYSIHVRLNDIDKSLHGNISIQYTNNSDSVLNQIYMHVWPNAYKDRNTAFSKQKLQNGDAKFYFASKNERGFIDSLQFSVNNEYVKWEFVDYDIVILHLNQPLTKGKSITIYTPFYVKLPAVFSRMGYENGIYCITQWYPKPAVFDVNGWNTMPYLDQGEFYGEFGKFTVHITVPANMVVAATGNLQNENELNILKDWNNKKNQILLSDAKEKTLTYTQDSIHDFAWFASKEFDVLFDTFYLHNGKPVSAWLFAKNPNKQGIEYIKKGIRFYSKYVGIYPYQQATVVITPLKAGSGMEYPTITNCADIDETTIIHEIGHNWFYGILGSNEREHPWMDESINTFYENLYQEKTYPKIHHAKTLSKENLSNSVLKQFKGINSSINTYLYTGRQNKEQSGKLPSTQYTDINYGSIVYGKNPLSFFYLRSYLGEDVFDGMMQSYYEKWKFKHPLPLDFMEHCHDYTKQNLDWFFNSALDNGRYDFAFYKKKDKLLVKNKFNGLGKVPISTVINDSILQTVWVEPNTFYRIDSLVAQGINNHKQARLTIDKTQMPLDLYGQNNQLWLKNNKIAAPVKLSPIVWYEENERNNVFYAPVYAYNLYNKNMLGIAFYNSIFPQKRNEFVAMPVFAFGTNDVNGYLQYWHNFYPTGKIERISVGFKSARFAANGIFTQSKNENTQRIIDNFGAYYGNITYEKIAPFIALNLKPKNPRSEIVQQLQARYVLINTNEQGFGYLSNLQNHVGICELSYNYDNPFILYPSGFELNYQQGISNSLISRLGISFTQSLLYKDAKNRADFRFFCGTFLTQKNLNSNTLAGDNYGRAMFQAAGTTGANDYLYDYTMIGRSENNPQATLWARQAILRDAGFRNFISVGSTDKFIFASNITVPFPIDFPLGFYADASYANLLSVTNLTSVNYNWQLTYSGGLYVAISKNVVSWYIPFFQSANILEAYNNQNLNNIFERSSLVLNLNKLNPIRAVRNLKL